MTRWKELSEKDEKLGKEYTTMVHDIRDMIMNGELKLSYKLVGFGSNGEGLNYAIKCATNSKDITPQEIEQHESKVLWTQESTDDDTPPNRANDANRGKTILVFDN